MLGTCERTLKIPSSPPCCHPSLLDQMPDAPSTATVAAGCVRAGVSLTPKTESWAASPWSAAHQPQPEPQLHLLPLPQVESQHSTAIGSGAAAAAQPQTPRTPKAHCGAPGKGGMQAQRHQHSRCLCQHGRAAANTPASWTTCCTNTRPVCAATEAPNNITGVGWVAGFSAWCWLCQQPGQPATHPDHQRLPPFAPQPPPPPWVVCNSTQ
jgi:hypothetical protein